MMPKIKATHETFTLVFERPDEGDIDEAQARNDADAWMQKKHGDLFMGGYAFEQAFFNERQRYVVEYTR